jgi:hypothetical protein
MPGCERCAGLDGKRFKVSEMEIGKNAPPLHPNCRCSIAPYEDSAEYDEWLENLENGGTTEEWEKQKAVEKAENDDIIASGVTDNFDRKTGPAEIAEDLAAVNPNYSTGEWQWRNNCQRCVPTYEMRRRGYNVTAKPRPTYGVDALARNYTLIWENNNRVWCVKEDDRTQISNIMAKWGDGARAEVFVAWNSQSGHVFVAEQINGQTVFYDPQNPKADASRYFDRNIKGVTSILRIDNNTPSDYILECCENRR